MKLSLTAFAALSYWMGPSAATGAAPAGSAETRPAMSAALVATPRVASLRWG
ncbi:hypothetical protein SHIRM173S_09638 [Streptomyces hirsutus]